MVKTVDDNAPVIDAKAIYLSRISPTFDTSVRGGPRRNIATTFVFFLEKERYVLLPDGEKSLKMCLFILTEYTNVTDIRTDGHRTTT